MEAIRVLMVARRSAVSERIAILNQLRHLCFTADDQTRRRFQDLSPVRMIKTTAALKPRRNDEIGYATHFALRALGRRARHLDEQIAELNNLMRPLIDRTAPGLLDLYGVGHDVAAKLLIAAGDNPPPFGDSSVDARAPNLRREAGSARRSADPRHPPSLPPREGSGRPGHAKAPAPRFPPG